MVLQFEQICVVAHFEDALQHPEKDEHYWEQFFKAKKEEKKENREQKVEDVSSTKPEEAVEIGTIAEEAKVDGAQEQQAVTIEEFSKSLIINMLDQIPFPSSSVPVGDDNKEKSI